MLDSALSLSAAQKARAASLLRSSRALDGNSVRSGVLEGFQQRNALIDYLFYDIRVILPAEASLVAPQWAAEGAILLVPPSGEGSLTLCRTVEDFIAAGGTGVTALAVAGVGSSALGSAAFARNIADAIGKPVAAVVSGYGLADLFTEAMGGFFWFGALNQYRHFLAGVTEVAVGRSTLDGGAADSTMGFLVRRSRDTRSTVALLSDERLSFDLLAGHSKGNLVVSEALYELKRRDPDRIRRLADHAAVVTVSAKIAMPGPIRKVIDVMGGADWFGGFNSRLDIATDHLVPGAGHHTNTELPGHLPVTETLSRVL